MWSFEAQGKPFEAQGKQGKHGSLWLNTAVEKSKSAPRLRRG